MRIIEKFGGYQPGDMADVPSEIGRKWIGEKIAERFDCEGSSAKAIREPVKNKAIEAPYGFKADGTPRKKPGPRKKAVTHGP